MLWNYWLAAVRELRPACSRTRTFFWMLLTLAGLCCRADNAGVTSFVRALDSDRNRCGQWLVRQRKSRACGRSHCPVMRRRDR